MNTPKHECPKCLGSGIIDAFRHIAGGCCYQCGGTGKVSSVKKRITQPQQEPAQKAKTVVVNNETCFVMPHGDYLQITGNTGAVYIDWQSAKNGKIKIVDVSNGWQRIKKSKIENELLSQLKKKK